MAQVQSIFNKITAIYESAAINIDITKNKRWKDIEEKFGDVIVRTVNARCDSIIIKGDNFEGIFFANLSISYVDPDDELTYYYGSGVSGDFLGKFKNGNPEFTNVNLWRD